MIIKGRSCTGPEVLGPYLTTSEKNERAEIVEIKGTVSKDIVGALIEMDAYAAGTQCEKPLYHLKLSPEPPYRLTREQLFEALDITEKQLGIEGHARVVVAHEYKGREHYHIVWARIDLENMRAVPDSHNYRKHELAARKMEKRFGHPHVQGVHAERDGQERPDRSLTYAEIKQQEKTGIKAKDVKRDVTAAFTNSSGPKEFQKALEEKGYILAKGNQRDFIIVDRAGGPHSLAKRIEGMRTAKLREFMAPLDRESLPNAEQAKDIQFNLEHGLPSAEAFERWDERVAESSIEKAKKQDELANKAKAEWWKDHKENLIERAYGRGGDFASQSGAAQKHHKRRIKELKRMRAEAAKKDERARHEIEEAALQPSPESKTASTEFDGKELTEAQRARIDRILQAGEDRGKSRDGPDRQHGASGGGRTRSR